MFILTVNHIDGADTIVFPAQDANTIILDIIHHLFNMEYYLSYTLMNQDGCFFVRRVDIPLCKQWKDLPAIVMCVLVDVHPLIVVNKERYREAD